MVNKVIQKWGFGMAPISDRMNLRYSDAVSALLSFLAKHGNTEQLDLDSISELKGMYNWCLRKDQWDWFSVYDQLGFPDRVDMIRIVHLLTSLRESTKTAQSDEILAIKAKLIEINLAKHLHNYQGQLQKVDNGEKTVWIYVLSTREQPNILKIGMTRRSVIQRVKEINAATGMLFPISARAVYRVTDAALAEKLIFQLLQHHRVRSDREFFMVDFVQAAKSIEDCLIKNKLLASTEY